MLYRKRHSGQQRTKWKGRKRRKLLGQIDSLSSPFSSNSNSHPLSKVFLAQISFYTLLNLPSLNLLSSILIFRSAAVKNTGQTTSSGDFRRNSRHIQNEQSWLN